MIRRTYPALDVTPGELRGVALHRKGRGASLAGGRVISLRKEDFTLSLREPNILEPRRFIEAVGEVLNPLAAGEERIALGDHFVLGLVGRGVDGEVRDAGIELAELIQRALDDALLVDALAERAGCHDKTIRPRRNPWPGGGHTCRKDRR